MQAIQVWPQLIQVAGDVIAKSQDWPGADKLAERLKKTIPPQFLDEEDRVEGGTYVDPAQMEEAMAKLEELEKENFMLKVEAKAKTEELEIKRYDSETQRIRALSDNEVDNTQLNMSGISEILAHTRELHKIEATKNAKTSEPSAKGAKTATAK
jgi:hypothetical protein